MGWQSDSRGYPDRVFATRLLPVNSAAISFGGQDGDGQHGRDSEVTITGDSRASLHLASEALSRSHIVAFPTETVYGLGANALDAEAVQRIFRAKGRPVDNPLIVHIGDLDMLKLLVPDSYQLGPIYSALAACFWPGALTLLLPVDEEKVPSVVRCGLKTVGVRMPSHPVARALIAACRLPLAAPSANASGRPSPTTALHVYRDMAGGGGEQGRLPYILDGGACQVGVESTVVDGVSEAGQLSVLRPGGVGVEEMKRVLEEQGLLAGRPGCSSDAVRLRVYGRDMARDKAGEANPTTPGMKYRHYSPDADVVLLVDAGGRKMSEMVFGPEVSTQPATPLQRAIDDYVGNHPKAKTARLRVGVMSMDDSRMTAALFPPPSPSNALDPPRQRFSLGSLQSPDQAARRLFQGLRLLDEGDQDRGVSGCDIIFVEALNDDAGVGLAIMNRLQKAAGSVIHVQM